MDEEEDLCVPAVGALYKRTLQNIDIYHPLHGIPYFGQSVSTKIATPNQAADKRMQRENNDSLKTACEIGLLAELRRYGKDAFVDEVLYTKTGELWEVQEWADHLEDELIELHGGILRDSSKKLQQTLNLVPGGKRGDWWKHRDHFRRFKFNEVFEHLKQYVDSNDDADVSQKYVTSSGFPLGIRVSQLRKGAMWKGLHDESELKLKLEQLPGWKWDATENSVIGLIHSNKTRWDTASFETKSMWIDANRTSHNTEAYKAAQSQRSTAMWMNWDEETRKKRIDVNTASHNTEQYKAAASQRSVAMWTSWDEETKKKRVEANRDSHMTDAYREAASQRTKAQYQRFQEERAANMSEIERASYFKKVEREKRKTLRKKKQLEALRRVEGYKFAKLSDIPKARKEGILPNIDV
jgi:hypothetical protein